MLFDDKKLTSEALVDLLRCPISTVKPFSLMLAPVYIWMKLNKKFVAVKSPLDFFTPEELAKLSKYETFYLPKFIEESIRFQTAARLVKNILTLEAGDLPPAPFEKSKELISVIAPLWGKSLRLEPFFMSIFTDELCGPLDSHCLLEAREKAVDAHDHGLLLSGAFIFIALQLGRHTHATLVKTRQEIYTRTVQGEEWKSFQTEDDMIIGSLNQMITDFKMVGLEALHKSQLEWAAKLNARLQAFEQRKILSKTESPSIYGPEGFAP